MSNDDDDDDDDNNDDMSEFHVPLNTQQANVFITPYIIAGNHVAMVNQ